MYKIPFLAFLARKLKKRLIRVDNERSMLREWNEIFRDKVEFSRLESAQIAIEATLTIQQFILGKILYTYAKKIHFFRNVNGLCERVLRYLLQ